MNVLVKFYIFDLPPGFADAELEISDGSTVNDVLQACYTLITTRQATMDKNELMTATVMVNGVWSDPSDTVSDGDTLTIIRPMDGG